MTIMTSVTMYQARLASVCRVIVMSGGVLMLAGAVVMAGGKEPQASHAIVAQANPFDPPQPVRPATWADPAWLLAFTGLVTAVGGYFTPIVLKFLDNAKLSAKIDELTAENRRLTERAISTGDANGRKLDKLATSVENAANATPQQQTITTLKTTTITPANIVFPDDDESTVDMPTIKPK